MTIPLTTARRHLVISNLRLQSSIGILAHELQNQQALVIDLRVHVGLQDLLPAQDDIDHVLDYRLFYDAIDQEARQGHIYLLETLAGKIAHRLMQVPGVLGLWLSVKKPAIFPNATVGVELTLGDVGT